MSAYRETQVHLSGLAEVLLQGPWSGMSGERETIAAYVSRGNECHYCCETHAAAARVHQGKQRGIVDQVFTDAAAAPIMPKLKAFLAIAGKVRRDGRSVQHWDVEKARAEGADDQAIHHTVLIAAAFCMLNRYVDGLETSLPADPADYEVSGVRLAEIGYAQTDYSKFRGGWKRP